MGSQEKVPDLNVLIFSFFLHRCHFLTPFIVMLILSILGGSNNEKHTICPFMVLNGRATEALTFYQEAFAGDILLKLLIKNLKSA